MNEDEDRGSGAWKVVALMLISAVLTGLASGFFFRIGTERDLAVMKSQTSTNAEQIKALGEHVTRYIEQQREESRIQTIFFREQAALVAELRGRLDAIDKAK